jgi:pyrroloquinoline quinone biosynthesis protein D
MTRPRLARKARLRWDERDSAYYLLWPERGMRLNETAAAALELCDGTHTIQEIVQVLAGRFGADRDVVAQDVETFIAQLRSRALVIE